MKKLIAVFLTVAIVLSMGILTVHAEDPVAFLDYFMVNGEGTNYNDRNAHDTDVHITIIKGETLKCEGWAYKIGTTLDRVYWQYFSVDSDSKFKNEPERACSNNYRSREDVAQYYQLDPSTYQYFSKSGFGADNSLMNLEGVSELDIGKYYVRLVAAFADGTTEVLKKKFILEVIDGTPAVEPKVIVNGTAVAPDGKSSVTLSQDGDKLVVTTNETVNDPWVSIPLGDLDASQYVSFTINYTVEGAIYGNNVYLRDTVLNTSYSPMNGSWAPTEEMNGKTSYTYVLADSFAPFTDKMLNGLRIPAAATAGAKFVIESITFNTAHTAEKRDFDASAGDGLSFDWILANGSEIANGNTQVIETKKGIDGKDGSITELTLYGWYGNGTSATKAFGYQINGGEIVYGDYFTTTEEAVTNLGANNRRFFIPIDVSGLTDENTIWIWAKLENGDEVKLNRFDNKGQANEKDREVYVIYNGPAAQNPPTAEASIVIFMVVAAAVALVLLKKKVF